MFEELHSIACLSQSTPQRPQLIAHFIWACLQANTMSAKLFPIVALALATWTVSIAGLASLQYQ